MTGPSFSSAILACLLFGLPTEQQPGTGPVPPPAQSPEPPPSATPAVPQDLSHEDMVKEQERRDREAEDERDRDDL